MAMISTVEMKAAGADERTIEALVCVRSMNEDELALLQRCVKERKQILKKLRKQEQPAAPKTGKMTVTLSAAGYKAQEIEVASYAEASAKWNEYRDENGFGASGTNLSSGRIKVDGKRVGYVSYNGRVWDRDGKEIEIQEGGKCK